GQRTGEAGGRRFGGGVDGEAAIAGRGDDGGDVDDASGPVGHHVAAHLFGQDDRRQHVQTDQRLYFGIAHGGQQPFGTDSGIVDESVDRAEGVPQALHEGGNLLDPDEIERHEMQAGRSGPADGPFQILARATRGRDHVVVAGGGEPARNRKPDAAAAAGDEGV